jgi:hypothetical protein
MDGHGEKGDRLLLASRDQGVVLPGVGIRAAGRVGEFHEGIGLTRHGGDHDRHAVAGELRFDDARRHLDQFRQLDPLSPWNDISLIAATFATRSTFATLVPPNF